MLCCSNNKFIILYFTFYTSRPAVGTTVLMLSLGRQVLRPCSIALALSRRSAHLMAADTSRPVEASIRSKLTRAFEPKHLEVLNESHMHAVPPGSESHFRVLVVSSRFDGQTLLQRHRQVNEALSHELSTSVHALAIQAKTPQQWSSNPSLAKSPSCLGGSKHDGTVAEKLNAGID